MRFKLVLLGFMFLVSVRAMASFDARQEVIGLMEKSGMKELLTAPVRVMIPPEGPMQIADEGIFIVQHTVLEAQDGDPNIAISGHNLLRPSVDKLVIVTHGWLDKGQDRWPAAMAEALCQRTDPNQWLCGSFDWKGGSAVISSVMAAQYARDIAGPRLAAAIVKLDRPFTHVHLIGHSAGSWVIQAAASRLAQAFPDTVFHLTFLDAYVPNRWDPSQLGRLFDNPTAQASRCWAEHYYTKDITLHVTEHNLKWAHNVDISALDPVVCEHEFPYRWYAATIKGHYDRWDERETLVYALFGNREYGFARSLEASEQNWTASMSIAPNKKAVLLKNPRQ